MAHHRKRSVRFALERLEPRQLLAADAFGDHNPFDPPDVNNDGEVSISDLREMVFEMREQPRQGERMFADVNADDDVTLLDLRMVVQALRARLDPGDGSMAAATAPIDGVRNNLHNPEFGAANTPLLRLTAVEYEDGMKEPAGADRPSARQASNAVAAQTESTINDRGLTDFVWQWGQFLDHDISLTEPAEPAEPFPVEAPIGDVHFDPFGLGGQTIDLSRSVYDPTTGDSADNPRQQINQVTSFIDASMVYGSDAERAAALRAFEGGRLKTSEGNLLPFNEDGLHNGGGPSDRLFLAGDVRVNEQVGLIAMHTLFVREHNRLAGAIAAEDASLTDEQIYQQARRLVAAEIQAITYNEFLPALLGPRSMTEYGGYDPTVNPSIASIFSTAAYRLGHSMLSPELLRLNEDGSVIDQGNLSLSEAFFAPHKVSETGIEPLLRGLASQQAQEIDNQVVDAVRNFLFGPPGAGGFDLASLNIQRGRDHGLPDYNQVRVDLGLSPASDFSDITSNEQLQTKLAQLYGDVNNIDPWIGMLAEDHHHRSSGGKLTYTILTEQFERLRSGDRFWYESVFSGGQLRELQKTTLADVIRRNTTITNIQERVFLHASEPLNDGGDPQSPMIAEGNAPSGEPSQTSVERSVDRAVADMVQESPPANRLITAPETEPLLAIVSNGEETEAVDCLFADLEDKFF